MAQTTSWRPVFILVLAGVSVALLYGKIAGAVPLLQRELGIGLVTAGWIVSIFNVIAAFTAVFLGAIAQRFGQGRIVMLGLLMAALGSFAGAFADGPALLLVTRAAEGFGLLLAAVSVPSLLMAIAAPRDLPVTMGLWGAYMPLGMGTMLLVGAPLLGLIGWRGMWILTAVIILAIAVPVRAVAARAMADVAPAPAPSPRDIVKVLRQPAPLLLALAFALYAGLYLSVIGFLPVILVDETGLSEATAALLTAIVVLANVGGNTCSGILQRRGVAPRTLMITGALVIAAGTCLEFLDGGVAQRFIGAFAFSGVGGLIPGTIYSVASRVAQGARQLSSITGIIHQGASVGQLVWPPLVAAVTASFGTWQASIPVCLAAAGMIVVVAFIVARPARATPAGGV